MSAWGAIVGFFTALPQIIDTIKKLALWFQQASGNDIPGFLNKVNTAFGLLQKADTEAQYVDAARAIRDAIRHKPS